VWFNPRTKKRFLACRNARLVRGSQTNGPVLEGPAKPITIKQRRCRCDFCKPNTWRVAAEAGAEPQSQGKIFQDNRIDLSIKLSNSRFELLKIIAASDATQAQRML
jgi:hypothetical protein